ncbi:bacterial peptide chain release factor 1 (bRF-1) [Isosphaera pallida ATCC 43644]|uniref:Peptide chain release factor 1 n=1 Tax=Isosphaera pallida (strain ATCC 43644 / DSM 9630 / IS1B) TaxID=575540 RepID=E8R053_ISOPI|nr:peptide chain release factor 1 [Isosphaera pallida]ADV61171.1 bacterial peptide chain release factor 1 (bRF-1) [Isosphaera pallida ATCC 43644]
MFEKIKADYRRYEELNRELASPDLVNDPGRLAALMRERSALAKLAVPYARYLELTRRRAEVQQVIETESDPEMKEYAQAEFDQLAQAEAESAEYLKTLIYEQATGSDHAGVIVEIRAGTGGDEAALFARDLYEMYRRFVERQGWRFEPLEIAPTELGGFREASFGVRGEGAYRHLQFESGGHRVQRVPVTETQGRIHTSAATVAVLPEPEEVEIELRDEDLQIDVMRAGGPGGQHQNKTESGVRITHLPSGIVVNCRDERSQHKNKAKALRILRSRLYEAQRNAAQSQRSQTRRSLIGSGDRSQRIRTYNFPQNRVTDHRINLTLHQLDRIVAGELELVTRPLIEHDRREQLGGFDVESPHLPV